MPLQEIAALNEMAVQSMAEGKCIAGAKMLSRGLRQLDGFIKEQDSSFMPEASITSFSDSSKLNHIRLNSPRNLDQVSPGNQFDFIPYVFAVRPAFDALHPHKFQSILASVMTCNLAVVHHHVGLASGSTSNLVMAMKLYQQMVGLHSSDYSGSTLLLVVAANMAQIQAHFMNWRKAHRWMKCALGFAAATEEELSTDILECLSFHSIVSIESIAAPSA